jgi:hypothetical protein
VRDQPTTRSRTTSSEPSPPSRDRDRPSSITEDHPLNEGARQEFEPVLRLAGVHIANDDAEEALKVLEQARKSSRRTSSANSTRHRTAAPDYAASISTSPPLSCFAKRDDPEKLTALFFLPVGTVYERHWDSHRPRPTSGSR